MQPRGEARKEEAKAIQKKAAKGVFSKFSLKGALDFFSSKETIIEYFDFDTDENEDYSDVLEYLKGRPEFQEDLEDVIFKKQLRNIHKFPIRRGNQRDRVSMGPLDDRTIINYQTVADFKCIFVREDKENDREVVQIGKIRRFLTDQLKSRKY